MFDAAYICLEIKNIIEQGIGIRLTLVYTINDATLVIRGYSIFSISEQKSLQSSLPS